MFDGSAQAALALMQVVMHQTVANALAVALIRPFLCRLFALWLQVHAL
jgi:hypothetical protein